MAIDRKLLGKLNERLEEKKIGDKPYFELKQQDIPANESIVIRLLDPEEIKGSFYVNKITYFLETDKTRAYVSPETLQRSCPIKQEIEEAKRDGDEEALQMIESSRMSVSDTFVIKCLVLDDVKFSKERDNLGAVLPGFSVRNDRICFFECSISVIQQIVDKVLDPQLNPDPEGEGIFDMEIGSCLTLSKKVTGGGTKKKTEYNIEAFRRENDMSDYAKFYNGPEDFSLIEYIESKIYTDEYLRQGILHFIYGDEVPDDNVKWPKKDSSPVSRKKKALAARKKTAEKVSKSSVPAKRKKTTKKGEAETPAKRKRRTARSLSDIEAASKSAMGDEEE